MTCKINMCNFEGKQMRRLSYARMCEELLGQIRCGLLAPGASLPSENQLALKYSICRSSVRTGLASLEQENLIGRQAGKGWFVRIPDPSLSAADNTISSRLYTIAADLDLVAVPWYHQILFNGIRNACSSLGIRQVFYDTKNQNSMRKGFCDGLICAQTGQYRGMQENPLLSRLPELRIHPVVVNRFYENPKIGYVSCDYLLEAQTSAEFLKQQNIGKICYVRADEPGQQFNAREQGVLRFYSGSKIQYCNQPYGRSNEEYTVRFLQFFRENQIPDAIYLENGSFASPLFRAFQKSGITPESAPVVFCFDDISYLKEFFDYSFFYLEMPLGTMMNDAVQYLIKKTDDLSTPVLKKLYRAEIKGCNTKQTELVI